jgi:hypothetical protein
MALFRPLDGKAGVKGLIQSIYAQILLIAVLLSAYLRDKPVESDLSFSWRQTWKRTRLLCLRGLPPVFILCPQADLSSMHIIQSA